MAAREPQSAKQYSRLQEASVAGDSKRIQRVRVHPCPSDTHQASTFPANEQGTTHRIFQRWLASRSRQNPPRWLVTLGFSDEAQNLAPRSISRARLFFIFSAKDESGKKAWIISIW